MDMTGKVFILSAVILLGVLNQTAFCEYRTWKDGSGKTIEAEHVRTTTDKVVLRRPDGTEFRVSLDSLSEKDRRYAILLTPPRIDMQVSVKTERDNKAVGPSNHGSGMQVQKETVQATVNVRKASSQPYEAPLVSEVYLVGRTEQNDMHMVLDRTVSRFHFTTENHYKHTYLSDPVSLKQLESGRQKGIEYAGYLSIVRDRTGEILAMKSNKLDFEKNAEVIIDSSKGTFFDGAFKPVDPEKSEKMVEKAKKSMNRRTPGRRF
jgi:hypothetical protein